MPASAPIPGSTLGAAVFPALLNGLPVSLVAAAPADIVRLGTALILLDPGDLHHESAALEGLAVHLIDGRLGMLRLIIGLNQSIAYDERVGCHHFDLGDVAELLKRFPELVLLRVSGIATNVDLSLSTHQI